MTSQRFNGAFFMEYSFSTSAAGFYGTLQGNKIYNISYYEEVENLINDAVKVLKNRDGLATFTHFDNESTSLLRIVSEGDTFKVIKWEYEEHHSRSVFGKVTEGILNKRKNIKEYVLQAIDCFRGFDEYGTC